MLPTNLHSNAADFNTNYLLAHPSIHPSIHHPFIHHPFITNLSIHTFIHSPIHPFIHPSIHLSICHESFHTYIHSFTHPSIHHESFHPSIHPSIHSLGKRKIASLDYPNGYGITFRYCVFLWTPLPTQQHSLYGVDKMFQRARWIELPKLVIEFGNNTNKKHGTIKLFYIHFNMLHACLTNMYVFNLYIYASVLVFFLVSYSLKTKYKNPTIIIILILIIIIFSLLTKKKILQNHFILDFLIFDFSFLAKFHLFFFKKKTGFSPHQLQGSSRWNGPYWATA